MSAEWLSQSSDLWGRVSGWLVSAAHGLAEPARAQRLRQLLMAAFALWALAALARVVWSLLPTAALELPADLKLLNPVVTQRQTATATAVDIEKMQDWQLFGEAAAQPIIDAAALAQAELEAQQVSGREGIEKGARKTRLDLKLRGVVASTDDGLGHAVIEFKKKQQIYAVEDKLPVPGRVFLAKVMPREVVLDNAGTYELLTLFEESELDRQLDAGANAAPAAPKRVKGIVETRAAAPVDLRGNAESTRVAQTYRDRLYQDPQSLAEVVQVTAVREGGNLRGYRVRPGKESKQFAQLGLKAGDLVTGVNGIALNDTAATMRIYQVMRSAEEAVFELQRGDQRLSVVVNLASADD